MITKNEQTYSIEQQLITLQSKADSDCANGNYSALSNTITAMCAKLKYLNKNASVDLFDKINKIKKDGNDKINKIKKDAKKINDDYDSKRYVEKKIDDVYNEELYLIYCEINRILIQYGIVSKINLGVGIDE